jgi:hypothetical protein
MLNPTSRIAKIVNVLATAQMHPANTAQIIKCGVRRTSARIEEVPKIKAGTLHRARKTPTTIMSEITTGEIPTDTNLVGASAAPNQAPAVKPDKIPTICSFRAREATASKADIDELRTVSMREKLPLGAQHCFTLSLGVSFYRITPNKTNPATNTTTGTQN